MYRYIKRFLDILISILLIPFVIFILFVLYPFIKISSPGPFIYKSHRLGKNMKKFVMYKIRTMNNNAPDLRNSDGSTFNSDIDIRVTKFGGFLRKSSLDELPQIFNVLIGNMSLVGPRPDLFSQKDLYLNSNKDLDKFVVKPGITGYAQVNGRNQINWDEKNKLDKFYTSNMSFLLDIKILIQTILYVIKRKGVNK